MTNVEISDRVLANQVEPDHVQFMPFRYIVMYSHVIYLGFLHWPMPCLFIKWICYLKINAAGT